MKANFDREITRDGIWNWEKSHVEDEVRHAQYAEEADHNAVWQASLN